MGRAWAVGILSLALAGACFGQVTITEFHIPSGVLTGVLDFSSITSGPDGNLWFTDTNGKVGRITTSGAITMFSLPTADSHPSAIVSGPDGNLWFTEQDGNKIGRITTSGVVTEFSLPPAGQPDGITNGRDGNLWFTEAAGNKIGRITTSGAITEFPIATANSHPTAITSGPDDNLWFAERDGNKIGRITTAGEIAEFPVIGYPAAIASGPDGNLWFTANGPGPDRRAVGRITTSGVATEFSLPTAEDLVELGGITSGTDGNLWFTDGNINDFGAPSRIGRITTSGATVEFPLPMDNTFPAAITRGPDGNLWFTEGLGIGRVALGGVITPLGVPTSVGVNPAVGSGAMATFTYTFSHTDGWQNLSVVNVLINNSLDGRHACYLGYDVRATTLVLVNDAGGAPYAGSVRPGHPGAIIENKQCAVSLVSIDADGTTLTMVLNISFKPGFSGDLIQYVAARDAFTSSGWASGARHLHCRLSP